jgi:hypothetical protein
MAIGKEKVYEILNEAYFGDHRHERKFSTAYQHYSAARASLSMWEQASGSTPFLPIKVMKKGKVCDPTNH